MATMNLGERETVEYATKRDAVRADAVKVAKKNGRRFIRIVGIDGQVLDVVECGR
jgi:hypothetical protein